MFRFLVVGLTIVLFALKMLGLFDHSWWLVFTPIFVYIALGVILFIAVMIYTAITNR